MLAFGLAAFFPAKPTEAQTAQTVQPGWQYIPSGIGVGQSFRLLFATSTTRNATSSDIADYNSFVQTRAATNTHLAGFSSEFRALVSTEAVDARDNTATTGTGVPIYWVSGDKVADNYADLYDGSWGLHRREERERGQQRSASHLDRLERQRDEACQTGRT